MSIPITANLQSVSAAGLRCCLPQALCWSVPDNCRDLTLFPAWKSYPLPIRLLGNQILQTHEIKMGKQLEARAPTMVKGLVWEVILFFFFFCSPGITGCAFLNKACLEWGGQQLYHAEYLYGLMKMHYLTHAKGEKHFTNGQDHSCPDSVWFDHKGSSQFKTQPSRFPEWPAEGTSEPHMFSACVKRVPTYSPVQFAKAPAPSLWRNMGTHTCRVYLLHRPVCNVFVWMQSRKGDRKCSLLGLDFYDSQAGIFGQA